MNRLIRRLFLIAACIFFAIVAPAVVLYAMGYRLQSRTEPRQVGVLLIETVPEDAQIEINGEIVGTSPEAVSNLPEGIVSVRITKDGYVPWEKHIPIEAAKAVELRTIKLFAEQLSPTIVAENITSFSLSPSRRLIAAATSDLELHVLSQDGEAFTQPLKLSGTPEQLLWSPDSTNLLVGYANNRRELVGIADDGLVRQSLPTLVNETSIVWDPRLPDRLLSLTPTGNLRSFSIATGTFTTIASNIERFALTRRQIVAATTAGALQWFSLTGALQAEQVYPELDTVRRIVASPGGLIALQNGAGQIYAVVDDQLLSVADRGEIAGFSPNGQILLVRRGTSELAVFNVDDKRTMHVPFQSLHTILRLSRPIRDPQWFAGGTHVVFQADDEIIISEIDTRDAPRQFLVDSTNTGNARAAVGEAGQEVLYLKRGADTVSLFSRDLVVEEDK